MPAKNALNIDFHSHILPGMDDGSKDLQTSTGQLTMLKSQGVEKVFLTPHFDFRRETRESFIKRRDTSYKALLKVYDPETMPELFLGAEVYISRGMENYDYEGLELGNTGVILMEFPHEHKSGWMLDLLESLMFERKKRIMIAHVNRAVDHYKKEFCQNLFDYQDLIFQINTSAFTGFLAKDPFKNYKVSGLKFVLGTDTHDLNKRAPDYDIAVKKLNMPSLSYIKKSVELTSALIMNNIG